MNSSSVLMSPLPKITVQRRKQKLTNKIPQMIKRLGKKRQIEILEEKSQGFSMEDQVKNDLDRIRLRTNKMKTMQLALNSHQFFKQNQSNKKCDRRKSTLPKFNAFFKKDKQSKVYLPELKQFIVSRNNQSDSLIKAKRRKIMHLLMLGLNRRNSGRLYQALDIVLLASFYFDRDDQERELKSLCLALISKLHKQIKKQKLSTKRKSKIHKKRKSLTVINYLSRENFMENFIQKLRKTKLVGEFSYEDSTKNKNNIKRINAKCDVMIPKPQQIFEQSLGVKNYDYVAITVDDYTNMFPYQYPKSLSQKINRLQYRQIICKLNGLLVPQSKCYSFSSILKIFFLPFLLVFSILFAFTTIRALISNDSSRIFLIFITILSILVLSMKVCLQQSGYTNYIQIKDKMKSYLQTWESKYKEQNIKFRMGENVDAIFIAFPSQSQKSSRASSKLTEIQQQDENFTENITEQRKEESLKNSMSVQKQSIRGARRLGSRFDQTGNIMKKSNMSKFASIGHNQAENKSTNIFDNDDRRAKISSYKNIDNQKKVDNKNLIDQLFECESRITQQNQKYQQDVSKCVIQNQNQAIFNKKDNRKNTMRQLKLQQPKQYELPSKNSNRLPSIHEQRKRTTVRFAENTNQISNKDNQNMKSKEIKDSDRINQNFGILRRSECNSETSHNQLIIKKTKSKQALPQIGLNLQGKSEQSANILNKIVDQLKIG